VVDGSTASFGHGPLLPVQNSTASHASVDERHTVVLGERRLVGHVAEIPVQRSSGSQAPVLAWQTVVLAAKPSAGQLNEDALHVSVASQVPVEVRHTTPPGDDSEVQVPFVVPPLATLQA
jgi:hypothetical protein